MTMCEAMGASHAFLEQPGELRLLLRGQCLADLVAEGGRALGDRLCGQTKRGPSGPWHNVEIHATGQEAVLGDWLNRLLYLAERDRWAPVDCQVLAVNEGGVRARVRGVSLGEKPCLGKAVIRPKSLDTPSGRGLQAEVILQPPRAASRHRASPRKHAAVTKGR
jgi:SHS2 domain-containing protein